MDESKEEIDADAFNTYGTRSPDEQTMLQLVVADGEIKNKNQPVVGDNHRSHWNDSANGLLKPSSSKKLITILFFNKIVVVTIALIDVLRSYFTGGLNHVEEAVVDQNSDVDIDTGGSHVWDGKPKVCCHQCMVMFRAILPWIM